MAEEIKHFSHEEHPLRLSQVDDVRICYGCQEQILEPTAYCCFSCDFFLHKVCAELPLEIKHPMHSQHPLVLFKESPYKSGRLLCNACGRDDWKFFSYHCKSCEFDLDVSCANIVDRRLEHESHEHPMILQPRRATFYCNACKQKEEDSSSYMCNTCLFWIHKRCASLPRSVKHKNHDHSLSLAYSLPVGYRSFTQYCPVCRKKVHPADWVYYCGPCRYFVHLTCIEISEEDTEQPQPREDINNSITEGELDSEFKQNLVRLPSTHATQELITHFLLERDQSGSDSSSEIQIIEEKVDVNGHKHPLILSKKVQTEYREIKSTEVEEQGILVCDWCIEPISLSDLHYTCEERCGYFLHVTCYNLPRQLQITKHPDHPLLLMYATRAVGFFRCNACALGSNGSFYKCDPCDLRICIKCAGASMIPSVAHDAHKHPLTQFQGSIPKVCSACGFRLSGEFGFGCDYCHLYLDYWCALLPPTHKRRWHDHPLKLMYPPYFEHPEEFYCVICELEINPNRWMYHCRECDYSLHPWCIPKIELLRYFKFGRSICVSNHSHPLTNISETKYIPFCEGCNKSLDREEVFECNACGFYLCPCCTQKTELSPS